MSQDTLERGAGCDQSAKASNGGHPMVGVMNAADAQEIGFDISNASDEGFVHVPVCGACHQDPGHRVRQLKCHFFPKQHAVKATRAAGKQSIGGGL